MNVLLFVTSLLMILSLMTYAKVDSFRYFLGMEAQFEKYMSTVERAYTNKAAKRWYKSTTAPDPNSRNKKKSKKGNSSPRISFLVFIDEKARDKNRGLLENTSKWAKDLMRALYGQHAFFKDAERSNPYFMDQILDQLGNAAKELTKNQKMKTAIDLSNLTLSSDVKDAFYLMLKGCVREESPPPIAAQELNQNLTITLDENDSEGDETEVLEEALEYAGAEGYDSLLNFITLRSTTKVRVYLATPPVLQAIVGDVNAVKSIIETRTMLYQGVSSESIEADDATEQLKTMFQAFIGSGEEEFLDFTVSKTNPAKYN